jgi:polysaccharide deacetylase family protein (PEP-CTERM system associated)
VTFGSPRRHILTVNLEDYFQLGLLSRAIPQRYWPRFETRVEKNTLATLDLLDEHGHKAVFFTVGWLADKFPSLMREVVRRGHEIGSKGFYHRSLAQMSLEEFRADAVRSRNALEKNCGKAVTGYRIASGWFSEKDLRALDILAEEGFRYDSSLRPLGLALRGKPELRSVHYYKSPRGGGLWEIPLSAWQFGPLSLPISGGNYVRQFPHEFMRRRVSAWVRSTNNPLVFYFHVWELDPNFPRVLSVSKLNLLRQYRNLDAMPDRIRYYLRNYSFVSPAEYLDLPDEPVALAHQEVQLPVTVVSKPVGGPPVTIVVPCYNEETSLTYLANTLDSFVEEFGHVFDFRFVFVDDGSKDRTHERMREIFGARANCEVVSHSNNRGVAAATLTGIKTARTEIVCVLDADCSYDPAQLAKMIPMLSADVDLVTASPYHAEGTVLNVPRWRLFLSRGVSWLYGAVLRNQLSTYTACVRVYRRSSAMNVKIENGGYLGIVEILVRLDQAGARIVECPAILEARVLGVSKMKVLRAIWAHLALLARLGVAKFAPAFQGGSSIRTTITTPYLRREKSREHGDE